VPSDHYFKRSIVKRYLALVGREMQSFLTFDLVIAEAGPER
jgi:hypothetical protein